MGQMEHYREKYFKLMMLSSIGLKIVFTIHKVPCTPLYP